MSESALESARELLRQSVMHYRGRPVGTVAALDPRMAAAHYEECFIRDFVPAALVFLNDGEPDIVRNFLTTVLELRTHARTVAGHELPSGVMPASFKVLVDEKGHEKLQADFGERAIGRVAPVDSMMWWTLLLRAYVHATGDAELAQRPEFRRTLTEILHLCLRDTFEVMPGLLVPDGCCMIDRRMGVYGHPLEIQILFFAMLQAADELMGAGGEETTLLAAAGTRRNILRTYLRFFFWLDFRRLNDINRYHTEELGPEAVNLLNIHPDSIPPWLESWLPDGGGYFVGNLGSGRMDFRFFALGNLLTVVFGLATPEQTASVLALYAERWSDLVGAMPAKIVYPAVEGEEWRVLTGCDPKNVPWSYHNGGNWPTLLWPLVLAAMLGGREDLAHHAFDIACRRLPAEGWPEYYDGRTGRLIGRRANTGQIWSASALILAWQFLERRSGLDLLPREEPLPAAE